MFYCFVVVRVRLGGLERDVRDAVAGGAWIFLGSLATSLSGFVFVIVVARLVGVDAIGIASMMFSSASIAVAVVSAGLNLAVIREVAASGLRVVKSVVALGAVLGLIAAIISIPLALGVGYGVILVFTPLMASLSLLSVTLISSLWGLEMFREYSLSLILASVTKLCVATALAFLGFKVLAPLIGYISYPLVAIITASAILIPTYLKSVRYLSDGVRRGLIKDITELLKLSLSNYPFVFSNQLVTMLSVYLFAYVVKVAASTGTLYVSLMITLAITALPGSILGAALPISTRRGSDIFGEGFRLGLSLAIPLTVFLGVAATPILNVINPKLLEGVTTLRILLASVPPLVALNTITLSLNRVKELRGLATVGVIRLVILAVLLLSLVKFLGIEGAALAFLIANTASLPIGLRYVKYSILPKVLTITWVTQVLLIITSVITGFEGIIQGVILAITSLIILHLSKVMTVRDLTSIAKVVVTGFIRREGKKN